MLVVASTLTILGTQILFLAIVQINESKQQSWKCRFLLYCLL